jgi:hypothetical protein
MQLHGFSIFMGVLIGFLAGRRPNANYLAAVSTTTGGGLRGDCTIPHHPANTYVLSVVGSKHDDAVADIIAERDASQRQPPAMFILNSMESKHATSSSSTTAIPPQDVTTPTTGAGAFSRPPSSSDIVLTVLTGLKGVSEFDVAADALFAHALAYETPDRKDFVLEEWTKQTTGGLVDQDRVLLSKMYREADSVFEYGLGESTFIASLVGVPRYSGIDSDPEWVAMARKQSLPHFRFYYADVGDTKAWGMPAVDLPKNALNYQAAPLLAEPLPFDVYMVDGRWRVPIVALSFLHASARGANHDDTKVLLHDCQGNATYSDLDNVLERRSDYTKLNEILELVNHSYRKLCVFKRKATTTNKDLLKFWEANAYSA